MTTSEVHVPDTTSPHPTSPHPTSPHPIRTPPATTGYRTTSRDDLITVLLGSLIVGGAATDAWAHANRFSTLESFFTPWHGMLYTGFAVTAAWTFWQALRHREAAPRWWRDGWPAGYRIGAIGAVLLAIGGLADMGWHTAFGIEVGLEATYSPSHLLLGLSGVLLLSSPMRSWWASGCERGLRTVAGVASAALTAAAAASLMQTLTAFSLPGPAQAYDKVIASEGHRTAVIVFGGFLVTSILILIPLLLVHRRRATPGAAPAIVALVASFSVITYDFRGQLVAAAVGAVLGAAVADAVLFRLDAMRGIHAPLRLPVAGALVAALTWIGYLLGVQLQAGVEWPPDLWAGVVTLTAMLGAALGGLAAGPVSHAPAPAE